MYGGWKKQPDSKVSQQMEQITMQLDLTPSVWEEGEEAAAEGGADVAEQQLGNGEALLILPHGYDPDEGDEPAYCFLAPAPEEPASMEEALAGPDRGKWLVSRDAEYQSLLENGTWDLVVLPEGKKAVQCKWVLRIKTDDKGQVTIYKSRLVAKGFMQKEKQDFNEIFAPMGLGNMLLVEGLSSHLLSMHQLQTSRGSMASAHHPLGWQTSSNGIGSSCQRAKVSGSNPSVCTSGILVRGVSEHPRSRTSSTSSSNTSSNSSGSTASTNTSSTASTNTSSTSTSSTSSTSTTSVRNPRLITPSLSTPRLNTPRLITPKLSTPRLSTLRLSTPRPSTFSVSTLGVHTSSTTTPSSNKAHRDRLQRRRRWPWRKARRGLQARGVARGRSVTNSRVTPFSRARGDLQRLNQGEWYYLREQDAKGDGGLPGTHLEPGRDGINIPTRQR
ncbi:unnamed protein product [Closterium sp. NIES-53]